MLERHERPVSVRCEADLDLGRRLRPVVRLPCEHDPGGWLEGDDLSPDPFDTLGRDLVETATGTRLEDDPLHLDAVAVLLVGRP